jgi:hypothetical protein
MTSPESHDTSPRPHPTYQSSTPIGDLRHDRTLIANLARWDPREGATLVRLTFWQAGQVQSSGALGIPGCICLVGAPPPVFPVGSYCGPPCGALVGTGASGKNADAMLLPGRPATAMRPREMERRKRRQTGERRPASGVRVCARWCTAGREGAEPKRRDLASRNSWLSRRSERFQKVLNAAEYR